MVPLGPYVRERQWGAVREDYSADGNTWDYLPHDHARSRTYRWGEDGLAGFCDVHQRPCLSLALWNGRDPTLKERAFGLTTNGPYHRRSGTLDHPALPSNPENGHPAMPRQPNPQTAAANTECQTQT